MKDLLKRLIHHHGASLLDALASSDFTERSAMLQGAQAALAIRPLDHIGSLADVGFRVFSQFNEDGIIEWLVSRLPGVPETFVEFGVEDYREANTRFLLRHRNWRGLVMDGSLEHVGRAKSGPHYWQHDLTAICAFIDRDNINGLIADHGFGGEIGLLSIDLDGNDYWVWQAIDAANPWLVIVEYNAVFGDLQPLTVPYELKFERTRAHSSNLYFGSGIVALDRLARERGYRLLGSNLAGNNAFFLREDLAVRFDGQITDKTARPSLFRESRAPDGTLSYLSGIARRQAIGDLPLVDVSLGKTIRFGDAGEIYSPRWAQLMGIK